MLTSTITKTREVDPLAQSGQLGAHVKKAMFKHRLLKVVQAIEQAYFWSDDEDEHGIMMLLTDAKSLASAV